MGTRLSLSSEFSACDRLVSPQLCLPVVKSSPLIITLCRLQMHLDMNTIPSSACTDPHPGVPSTIDELLLAHPMHSLYHYLAALDKGMRG